MSERDRQLERDVDVGLDDSLTEPSRDSSRQRESGGSGGSRIRNKAESVVSSRGLLIAVVLTIGGAVLGGAIPLLGFLGNLLGVLAAGFAYGVSTDTRRYVEMTLAGALAGGGLMLLGNVVLSILVTGGTLIAVGAVAGALTAAAGHYFGRDFRAGLTRDLGEAP